jgi:hypothetical protein
VVARKLSEQRADRVDVLLKPRFAEGPDFVFFSRSEISAAVFMVCSRSLGLRGTVSANFKSDGLLQAACLAEEPQ